jgi:Ferritin-like domain
MKPTFRMSSPRTSRRSLLKGTAAGVAGVAATSGFVGSGLYLFSRLGSAHASSGGDSGVMTDLNTNKPGPASTRGSGTTQSQIKAIQNILNIAVTAEMLGVTFYKQALVHAGSFNLSEKARLDLKAALIEEQLHQQFLAQQGAKPLTNKFSLSFGRRTFEQFETFIKTQQLLEIIFVAAYLAAIKEFAQLGRPDLAQIAAQIGSVEAEHRAIGRAIGGMTPANNRAFSQVLLKQVADTPKALQQAGFLNPSGNNAYIYEQASMDMNDIEIRSPWG